VYGGCGRLGGVRSAYTSQYTRKEGRTPCLPRQNTKLLGSPFFAGSAELGTCVRVFRCVAAVHYIVHNKCASRSR